MSDDELRGLLQTIIEQNRQVIAMLSGQWTAMGGYTQSNYGQIQSPPPSALNPGKPKGS